MGDNLLLSSVFQFSRKIRQSIDKTAGKIRYFVLSELPWFKPAVPFFSNLLLPPQETVVESLELYLTGVITSVFTS
jgi:hypothetical protein